MRKLFSERFRFTQPRVREQLDGQSALALIALVSAKLDENWFGASYPFECQDGRGNAGCGKQKLKAAMDGYKLIWPDDWRGGDRIPEDHHVFDLVEFSYEHVAFPGAYDSHSYWGHSNYSYAQDKGREAVEAVSEVRDNVAVAIDKSLKKRPYTTLALTLALGFLLGAIWAR